MTPGSQAAVDGGAPSARSGGKIYKRRPTAARKTPYDRPTPPQPITLQPESPNWLAGLVSPAKIVAGGASKLISSLWNPVSWGSPSSSSDSDSDSEDGLEDDYEDKEYPPDEVLELDQQKKGSSSEKSEILHLVEQLLMLEHYSREECDRLIEIVRSRVIDAGPSMIVNRNDDETADIRSQVIMEAKRLVMRKKVGLSSESDLDNGIYAFKSAMTPHITEGEADSPVDVAKSYMRSRPPWVSPMHNNDSPTPVPLASDLFKEGTPYSSAGGSSFRSTKRDHLSAGSWNIQDELRRLRSKATEDMLSSRRSTKHASFTLEHDFSESSLANNTAVDVVKRNKPMSSEAVDEIVNLAAAEGGTPGLSEIRTPQDDLPTQPLSSLPTKVVQEQNQDMNSIEMVEGVEADSNKSHHNIHPDNEQNPRHSGEGNGLKKEENSRQYDERNLDHEITNNGDRTVEIVDPIEGNCQLLTESMEVPDVNESTGIVNDSQDSSNANNPNSVAKADSPTGKRVVTRATRYGRRTGGRVKQ